ncbi:hypothetical protein [Sorangium sp. So ce1000]|uniref:hypothetical protein n=1 Tax=Sorangium sp. So ce1000 TaxID=3133325 RepID=UPI003F634310
MPGSSGTKLSAVLLAAMVGYVTVPACTLTIGPGQGDAAEEGSTAGDGREEPGGETTPATPGEPEAPAEPEEPSFEELDPQELALASAKAGFAAYYLTGTVESLGLDPATLDETTLAQLVEQYLPVAAAEAGRWLETLDPAALPLAVIPRIECEEEFHCPYSTRCRHNPPPVRHGCYVTNCADAKCRQCPEIFGEIASRLIFKSWCTYVCVQTATSPPKEVAHGIVFMTHWGDEPLGPWCIPR